MITYPDDPRTMVNFPDRTEKDLGSRNVSLKGYLHYQPAETNTSIREGWFTGTIRTRKCGCR